LTSKLDKRIIGTMILFPMDSVRYFEFDFLWKAFSEGNSLGDYLDVSSPRLFSMRALKKHPFKTAILINPVMNDLVLTRGLMEACGISAQCEFYNCLLEDFNSAPAYFDTIVSISVVEHIPDDYGRKAVQKMWDLLRSGGKLLLSVPCAKEAFDEYLDFNEYELLTADSNNFVFGQRFYDEKILEENIYDITGKPARFAIYGEKEPGMFKKNRDEKFLNVHYPHWREPYMMGKDYMYFDSIGDLPGWGVIAMEFVKK
jgi:SAM-dependent methyltransferase